MKKSSVKNRILVVDDEPDMCSLLSTNLSLRGFKTTEAHNGIEGYEAIKKIHPDLVILDVLMPKMGGFEVLKRVKGDPKYSNIPIIMLTAQDQPENLDKGISLRADFYLPKPFNFDNLMGFINMVLRG